MITKQRTNLDLSASDYKEQYVATTVDHILLDVRSSDEYGVSHLIGAVNVPLQEIPERLSEIPQTKPVVLYCRTGNRSGQAAKFLAEYGYEALNVGGLAELARLGLPVEPQ